ncbi:hypothetical protein [Longitalea luteola]|uniref:hypothetical protein n=1 Tax=Longitalea luteola TaxID=2812563 RepID=UPI001A970943|nr:hypothetical protein [Longitalea luteola]
MPTIHVALQEGFEGDTVIVLLDGAEVFYKDNLKTRMQIGKAASFDLPNISGPHELRFDLISRNTRVNIPVTVTGSDKYVGISITRHGDIAHTISDEPFRYA